MVTICGCVRFSSRVEREDGTGALILSASGSRSSVLGRGILESYRWGVVEDWMSFATRPVHPV